jgi:diacylglycerol kinase (ATP)
VILLHNPDAGDADYSNERVCALIRQAGHTVVARPSETSGWKGALDTSADLIAVAGGDGTVAEVIRTQLERRSRVPVTLLPLGSANNIARTLGLADRGIPDLIAAWNDAGRRRYSPGEVALQGSERAFLESLGGGLLAEAIRRAAEREEDEHEDKVLLGLRLLRELIDTLPAQAWTVEADGSDHSGDYVAVEAMVIGHTGPGIPLADTSDPTALQLVLIGDGDRAGLRTYLETRLRGSPARPPSVTAHAAHDIQLTAPENAPLRLDDRLLPHDQRPADNRLSIRVSTTTAQLLVP